MLFRSGFNGLDDALVYIELNIEHFNEFKTSPNWTILKSSFLPTVKIVEDIPFNIQSSRLIFLAFKPNIAYIEDTVIRYTLGEEIYNAVKSDMVADDPLTKTLDLLPYIRKPLIYLASASFMEESGAELTNKGLFFSAIQPVGTGQNTLKNEPASEKRILAMIARNLKMGENYLDMLRSYLKTNWTEYSGAVGSAFSRDNTGKKTFFA